jgi:hypothetical protein
MIRKDTANNLKLPIQPCVGNEHPSFIMADGHRRSPEGFVQVDVDIEGCKVPMEMYVLDKCLFAGLLGWDFMTQYGAHINADAMTITFKFEGREVSSSLSMTEQATSSIPVSVAATVELKPHETQAIRVKVADGANARADGQTWGFFAGAASGRFVCRNGYGNVAVKRNLSSELKKIGENDEDQANFIVMTNTSKKTLKLPAGKVVASFVAEPLDSWTTSAPTEDDQKLRAELKGLSDVEIDARLAALPHLEDLDLSHAATNMSPAGYRGIKEVMLMRERLLQEVPKQPPPSEHECKLRLINGAAPRLQGRPLTVNPKVRDELGRIINDKLERGIIEPSKSPFSSTVLPLPKPKGGIRFVLDYRALNKCLIGDAYTLPRVEETTTALRGAKYFSTLDVKEAFWSVPLAKESRELTAFRTPLGLF